MSQQEDSSIQSHAIVTHPWTREEIEDLHDMSYRDHTVTEMAYELQRPRKNVLRALRRIQTQQAIFHPLHEVATAHNMSTETLTRYLHDPLYYVPLRTSPFPLVVILTTVVTGFVSLYGYLYFHP